MDLIQGKCLEIEMSPNCRFFAQHAKNSLKSLGFNQKDLAFFAIGCEIGNMVHPQEAPFCGMYDCTVLYVKVQVSPYLVYNALCPLLKPVFSSVLKCAGVIT